MSGPGGGSRHPAQQMEATMDQLAVTLSELGSLALILWIVIAVVQLRLLQLQRKEEIVLRLYEPLLAEPLTRAYWRVQTWDFADFASYEADATLDDRVAFDLVATFYETMGVMHHRRVASLALLDELLSSSVFEAWEKCRPIIRGERERTGTPQKYAWFEDLVKVLDARLSELQVAHPVVVV
jgi:hypothetical protein